MSAHTGETEIETIETPTPPKLPSPQNRREDDIIEEDPNQDSEEDDDSQEDEEDESEDESEIQGNYRYTYETDSDDPFSGDIECCLSCPSFGCIKSSDSDKSSTTAPNVNSVQFLIIGLAGQISILGFVSFSVTWLLIGYLMPKCLCSDLFQHIIFLPISFKLILMVGIMFFPFLTWFCYHTFSVISKRQANGLFGMLIMLISLILASIITNCVFIFKSGGWTTYQIYNRDFYNRAHAAFINQKVFEAFTTLGSTLGGLSKDKSLEDTFSEFFQPQGLAQIESLERLMKWTVLGGWFIFNIFMVSVIFNLIKYRKMYYDGLLEVDGENLNRSRTSLKSRDSRSSRRSKVSQKSKRSRSSMNGRRGDRPPSYRHISPPKSVYSDVHTVRSVKSTASKRKMRNFNTSEMRNSFAAPSEGAPSMILYSNDHHHPVRYQPNDSFRTLQPDRSRRIQNEYIEVHNPYHTIQKKPKRTNQEDFLY